MVSDDVTWIDLALK
jgi:hypothetical protein